MKALKVSISALIVLLITSCSNEVEPVQSNVDDNPVQSSIDNPRQDIPLSKGGEEVVRANNNLAFKLIDNLNEAENNVVVSPLSFYQYFAMVANGANGETRKEIEEILGAGHLSVTEINTIVSDLVTNIKSADKRTDFTSNNSFWYANDAEILPNYISILKECYATETHAVDSLNCRLVTEEINEWCEKNTSGIIKEFLERELPDTVKYVSYNAAYFRSEWEKPFETVFESEFHNADGTIATATYISGQLSCRNFENDDIRYVEIPYGNGAFAFSIILPKKIEAFNLADLNIEMIKSKPAYLSITFPKFSINYKKGMSNELKAIGINKSFSAEADFSNASSFPQILPEVLHAASIEVDERGALAASVTGSGIDISANIDYITIDRPFIFLIRETSTSSIIYIGKINNL